MYHAHAPPPQPASLVTRQRSRADSVSSLASSDLSLSSAGSCASVRDFAARIRGLQQENLDLRLVSKSTGHVTTMLTSDWSSTGCEYFCWRRDWGRPSSNLQHSRGHTRPSRGATASAAPRTLPPLGTRRRRYKLS